MTNNFTFEGDPVSSVPGPAATAVAGNCANCKTWLSLDEWAQIIGINPLHFNGLTSTLIPNNVCGEVFFQYSWQHSDRVGREDICMAIKQAEDEISKEAGFNLMPDWTVAERLNYARPSTPEAFGFGGTNPRGLFKSVELPRGYLISGGVRTKSLIQAGAAVARQDLDTDQFQETCTVTVSTTVTDINEIHAYYPSQSGDDCWEIRPISVNISGGVATIVFKVWQIVAANQKARFDPEPLDAADAHSFETRIDVYRVYNNPASQLQFLWEGDYSGWACGTCTACQLSTQTGCFHMRDQRMGFIVPAPGSWNSSSQQFDGAEWSVCRDPDQLRAWYYSGYIDQSLPRPYAEMSPYWKYAVAFYAASLLDRPVCGCSNIKEFIDRWRMDAMFNADKNLSINVPIDLLSNRLGTTAGAIYAYKRVHQNGVRVNK